MNRYDLSDAVRVGNCSTAVNVRAPDDWEPFTNEQGAAADPTEVTLTVTKPSGTQLVYVWPTPGAGEDALERESVGRFSVVLPPLDEAGTWKYVLAGTGDVVASQTYAFTVRTAGMVSA